VTDGPERSLARSFRLDFGFATALAMVAAVLAAMALARLVSAASQPIGWAIACITVATLLRPVLAALDRRLPHALAVIVTILGLGLLMGLAWAGAVNTVADNFETLKEDAPIAAAEIEADSEIARDFGLTRRVEQFVDELDEELNTSAVLQRSASTVSTYVVTGILVLFLIGYGPKFVTAGLAQIDDERRRERVARVGARAVRGWQIYVWAVLAMAAVLTLLAWLLLWSIDVPAPFVLALFIGGFSLIPLSGIVLGGLPALLFTAATLDPPKIGAVLAFLIAAQLVESLVVRPRIDRRSVAVGPALPLIVGLLGWEIYGLGGAVYGVLLLILALAVMDAMAADEPEDVADRSEATESASA
jgi:predicted PurR-regulated permease PerM